MRKVLVVATGVLTLAVAAPSVAQSPTTTLTVDASVSSTKAGTKKKPRSVKLKIKTKWDTQPADAEKPVTESAVVLFPKGSLYNGGKLPKCSQNTLARSGPKKCPKGSIMGKGSGNAYADDVITRPTITVVNGGAKKVYLYTVMTNPARVQAPVPGTIKKMSGKWAYKLTLKVPKNLQVVAGVPIALRDLTINAGKGKWLQTTGCSGGKWNFEVTTNFTNGSSAKTADSVRCKK